MRIKGSPYFRIHESLTNHAQRRRIGLAALIALVRRPLERVVRHTCQPSNPSGEREGTKTEKKDPRQHRKYELIRYNRSNSIFDQKYSE